MTYKDQLRSIADDFFDSLGKTTASSHEIAAWAIKGGRWHPQPADLTDQCAKQIAVAMREDYFTDPQGRRVRSKHAARILDGNKEVVPILWTTQQSS